MKWLGYAFAACLILAVALGIILAIRVLALVIAFIVAVAFIALLLNNYFTPRRRDKAHNTSV